jgi:hypothetical protein
MSLPELTARFSGGSGGVAQLGGALPRPTGVFAGEQLVDEVQLTVVVGLSETFPVSTYEQFPFNSFCNFEGRVLAAGPDGIYALDVGEDDDGVDVPARVRWGQLHFATRAAKRPDAVYVAARSSGDLTVRLIADESGVSEQTLEVRDVDTLRQRRVKPGKGLRGNYIEVEIENVDGADFDLDVVTISVAETTRRI